MGRHEVLLVAALAVACAPVVPDPTATTPAPVTTQAASVASAASAGPGAPGPEGAKQDIVLVTERAALAAIEARGGAFGRIVDGSDDRNNDALAKRPGFAAVVAVIEQDVRDVARADRQSGVGVGDKPHRLFDVGWLRSPAARFELVGVSNRMDRRGLDAGACGEVRFVYRLAYATEQGGVGVASRLPATIAVSLWARDDHGAPDCARVAGRWRAPAGLAGEPLGAWLVSGEGPLAPPLVARDRLRAVELNVQIVRWPSTVRPDMAGHAEYLLRALRPKAGGMLEPAPLDNTPDVAKLLADRTLLAELVRWVRDPATLERIDAGTSLLPERFSAMRAVSVSPRGLARRANRPFRRLIEPRTLADLPLGSRRTVRSPAALLRRLDELSCQGCHQSRSVAGFHLLGEDAPGASVANAIASPISPHLAADLPRRLAELAELAQRRSVPATVPFAERADGERGTYGARCARTDGAPAAWTCEEGLSCTLDDASTDDADVGVCLPRGPLGPGDPCEIGRVGPEGDPHRDRIAEVTRRDCGVGVCEKNGVGFPGGMCSTSCESRGEAGVCGAIAILSDFNACLAQKKPFDRCLAEHTRPAGLRACDVASPCRDDYICARTNGPRGACIPPYFLFQLRVDGHPLAKK